MEKTKIILVIAVLLVIFTGGGFYAGRKYQQSKSPRFGNFSSNHNGQFQPRFNQGIKPVRGEIIILDDQSITIKLPDGAKDNKSCFLAGKMVQF